MIETTEPTTGDATQDYNPPLPPASFPRCSCDKCVSWAQYNPAGAHRDCDIRYQRWIRSLPEETPPSCGPDIDRFVRVAALIIAISIAIVLVWLLLLRSALVLESSRLGPSNPRPDVRGDAPAIPRDHSLRSSSDPTIPAPPEEASTLEPPIGLALDCARRERMPQFRIEAQPPDLRLARQKQTRQFDPGATNPGLIAVDATPRTKEADAQLANEDRSSAGVDHAHADLTAIVPEIPAHEVNAQSLSPLIHREPDAGERSDATTDRRNGTAQRGRVIQRHVDTPGGRVQASKLEPDHFQPTAALSRASGDA